MRCSTFKKTDCLTILPAIVLATLLSAITHANAIEADIDAGIVDSKRSEAGREGIHRTIPVVITDGDYRIRSNAQPNTGFLSRKIGTDASGANRLENTIQISRLVNRTPRQIWHIESAGQGKYRISSRAGEATGYLTRVRRRIANRWVAGAGVYLSKLRPQWPHQLWDLEAVGQNHYRIKNAWSGNGFLTRSNNTSSSIRVGRLTGQSTQLWSFIYSSADGVTIDASEEEPYLRIQARVLPDTKYRIQFTQGARNLSRLIDVPANTTLINQVFSGDEFASEDFDPGIDADFRLYRLLDGGAEHLVTEQSSVYPLPIPGEWYDQSERAHRSDFDYRPEPMDLGSDNRLTLTSDGSIREALYPRDFKDEGTCAVLQSGLPIWDGRKTVTVSGHYTGTADLIFDEETVGYMWVPAGAKLDVTGRLHYLKDGLFTTGSYTSWPAGLGGILNGSRPYATFRNTVNYTGINQFKRFLVPGKGGYLYVGISSGSVTPPSVQWTTSMRYRKPSQYSREPCRTFTTDALIRRSDFLNYHYHLNVQPIIDVYAQVFPGYDCFDAISNGIDGWNASGCLLDIADAGLPLAELASVRASFVAISGRKPYGAVTGINGKGFVRKLEARAAIDCAATGNQVNRSKRAKRRSVGHKLPARSSTCRITRKYGGQAGRLADKHPAVRALILESGRVSDSYAQRVVATAYRLEKRSGARFDAAKFADYVRRGDEDALEMFNRLGVRGFNLCKPGIGGVYVLVRLSDGAVIYAGQTNDFDRREAEHMRQILDRFDNVAFRFDRIHLSADYDVRRGLEQLKYNEIWGNVPVSVAKRNTANPSSNRQRPMSFLNPRLKWRLKTASAYRKICA